MNRKLKNAVNNVAGIHSSLLSLGNQAVLSYIEHASAPPIQRMKIKIGLNGPTYDTEDDTDAIISFLKQASPEHLFLIADQLAGSIEPDTASICHIRQYVDYHISKWQLSLNMTDHMRFAGAYSYMPPEPPEHLVTAIVPYKPPKSASLYGGRGLPPEYKTDDIPLLGPTRAKLPGKEDFTPDDSVDRIREYKTYLSLADQSQPQKQKGREGRPIHRGEMEIEMVVIDGQRVPFARIYLTVYAPESNFLQPTHKDIFQKIDGKISILAPAPSSGSASDSSDSASSSSVPSAAAERVTYMNVGRPVRALQWVDNYLSQQKPDANPVIRSFLVPLKELDDILIRAVTQEDKQLFERTPTGSAIIENSDQPAAPNQYGLYASEIENLAFKGSLISFTESGQSLPHEGTCESFSKLRERLGIPSLSLWDHMWVRPSRMDTNLKTLYATWYQYINKSTQIPENLIAQLKQYLIANQLIAKTEKLPDDKSSIKKITSHFTSLIGGGFYSGPDQGKRAEDLAEMIDLWGRYLKGSLATPSEQTKLLKGLMQQHLISSSNQFPARDNPLLTAKISWFMRNMAAPWASLGAATGLLADDYDRLKYDTELRSSSRPDQNNFSRLPGIRKNLSGISGFGEMAGVDIDNLLLSPQSLSPVVFIHALLKHQPELELFFREYSNINEKLRFYEHAQLVLYQYLLLTKDMTDEKRLLKKSSVVKMILFHDMHKWSSRLQFHSAGRHSLEEGTAEHVLPSQEMARYWLLWGAGAEGGKQLRMARAMLNGDPIGTHIKSNKPLDQTITDAVKEFHMMARSAGIGYQDYYRFFLELLEFYMADSSSYAAALPYVLWEERCSNPLSSRISSPSSGIKKSFFHESDKLKLIPPIFDTQHTPIFVAYFLMAEDKEKKLQQLAKLFKDNKETAAMEALITSRINPAPQVKKPVANSSQSAQDSDDETLGASMTLLFNSQLD